MHRKFILIDAEPVVRSAVTSILKRKGHSVTATDDIYFAIEACKREKPDLVLTNVYLPGITGHEAMKLIKDNCPDTPVLMVSGLPNDEVIRDWVKEANFDLFPKPFSADSLLSKIEEIVSRKDGERSSGTRGQAAPFAGDGNSAP